MPTPSDRPQPGDGEAHSRPTFSYRPALDGIRALAVLAVFAYHLGYPQMRGGYLGVDVFFVLSGYLITTLLLREHDATGRIDLLRFWGRRARRLLPALLIVVVAVALWVSGTSPVFELSQRRQDLFWAVFYGSNWHLIAGAQDYFALYESASMMRHTWSLAIEEQFYLAWPLLVLGATWLCRGRTRALAALWLGATALSIGLMAVLYSPGNPSRAYYGTEARVHQLLIGALLALLMLRVPRLAQTRRAGTLAAVASCGFLLVAFVTLGDGSAAYYRGLSALIAVAAAGLIWGLEVAPGGLAGRAFGVLPMRWVGGISYGVYLWHWPVILAIGAPMGGLEWLPGSLGLTATRVLMTFIAAGLSFYLVERPVRLGSVPVLRQSLPRFGLAISAAVVSVVAATVVLTAGPSGQTAAADEGGAELGRLGCELETCVRHRATHPEAPVMAVVGDSIPRSMDPGFLDLAKGRDWTYVTAASDGCRVTHLLTAVDGQSARYEACYRETPRLFSKLLARWDPDVVIVLDMVENADFIDHSGRVVESGSREWVKAELRELEAFAAEMIASGARVVFMELPPLVATTECLREDAPDDPACVFPASNDERSAQVNEIVESVVAELPGRAFLVSLNDHICPGGLCPPKVDSVLLRYDGHHFTRAGARWAVPLLHTEMLEAGALPDSMR